MKKSLTLLLTALLLASSFASCGESEVNTEETAAPTAEVQTPASEDAETVADEETRPMHAVPEDLDFEGAVFNILYPEWQGYLYYFFSDEQTGDAMGDAIFNRTVLVEDYLNVDLTQYTPGYIETIPTTVQQSVQSGDDQYQLALLHCIQGVSSLVTQGMLYNYDNLEYVDYTADWWNREMMDSLRLGKNTYYGVSDYMIPCPYAIYFNKDIISDFNLDNPYELVYNKQWTVDKFIEMATVATTDSNGDGKFTPDDIRGVCTEENSKYISFMTGAGQFMMEKNAEGKVELCVNTDKMMTLIEKFAAFANIDGVVADDNTMSIVNGNLLFELHTIANAVNIRESECDIGILPYPMYDESQENYISLDWGGLMCIPTTIQNPKLVGATLELLAYESGNEVIPTYYDVLLEGKLARDTDTVAMIDILFDTIAYEPGGNYFGFESGFTDYFYVIPRLAIRDKSTDFASWDKKLNKPATKLLERFYTNLDKVEAEG